MKSSSSKKFYLALGVILLVLIIDQCSKFWVKTNMTYGEEFLIFGQEWARIHFVENEGMAFGLSLGGHWGKILLTVFRVIAAGFLIYLLRFLIRRRERTGVILSIALIFAGAMGNIIDSLFYGMLFSESTFHGEPAILLPEGGGYGQFLMGKVVDMLYFPMIDTYWPSWMPLVGGNRFQFFQPVFNVADSAISVGVAILLLFYRDFFSSQLDQPNKGAEKEPLDPANSPQPTP